MARSTDSAQNNPTRSGKRKGGDTSSPRRSSRKKPNNESNPPPKDGSTHESDQIATNEEVLEQRNARDDFKGGVSVIKFLRRSFRAFPDNKPLSDDWKKKVASALHGMKIRVTHGRYDKKLAFQALASETTQDFKDGDDQIEFDFKYKQLPCLELGNSTYVPMEWCAVYGKDNPSNEKLRRILSPETLKERHYLDGKCLEKQWQFLFLDQETPESATITKFRQALASKCGESSNDKVILIPDGKEGKRTVKLPAEMKETKILLCVMKKRDKSFYKALKREAEVEKEILTQCCLLEKVEHYCDLHKDLRDLENSGYVVNLAVEMIAKVGNYKKKAVLPLSALPPRFGENCKVMYLGYNVINCCRQITVFVGSTSTSVLSTCGYHSKVACGDYMQKLPEMFGALLKKYKEANGDSAPEKIIVFREGFMGGKHQDKLREEVDDLRGLTNALITFIVPHKNNGKANYRLYADENRICCSEFDTLIKNLCYSWRCPKPLPAYYADLAATSAKIYLEGNENSEMPKIENAVNKILYVRGEHVSNSKDDQNTQQRDRAMEQQQNEEMEE